VHLNDAGSLLLADRVVFDRSSGDADASGTIRVSYLQPPAEGSAKSAQAAEPVHVLAERAELREDSDATTFYGKPVRMWQGGSQIQAPVVTLRREERQMTARGDAAAGFPTVRTLLVNTGMGTKPAGAVRAAKKPKESASAGAATTGTGAKAGAGSKVIRVESTSLVYSDAERTAHFTGDVTIANAGETIRSREATAFLSPASPAKDRGAAGADAGMTLNGSLERVVAEGDVRVDDAGRKATGERLVYTAADGLAVLTGTATVLPSVTDTGDGSRVTAPAFLLHTGDNSVEALRAAPGDSAGRQRVSADAPVR
jgi:lipopolysaccharide export system protein LptA